MNENIQANETDDNYWETQTQKELMDELANLFGASLNMFYDNFDNSKIKDFENKLLDEIKSNAPDILNSIRDTGKLEGKTEEKLKNLLDKMKENFNA